jgi:hypothetical protein
LLLVAVIDWSWTGIRVPSMCAGQCWDQVMDDPVNRRLAGVKQCRRLGGQAGAQ